MLNLPLHTTDDMGSPHIHLTSRKQYVTPEELQQTCVQFEALCADGQSLFEVKNQKYNSAFEAYGLLGVIFELMGAVSRLPSLVMWNPTHGADKAEELRDILTDIHNYANMAMICVQKHNWDGR